MAFLFGASIVISILSLAFAIGRVVAVRPPIRRFVWPALAGPLIFLLLLIPWPVNVHSHISVGVVVVVAAGLAILISFALPTDRQSRTLKLLSLAAGVTLMASNQYIGNEWVPSTFARKMNAVARIEQRSFARFLSEEEFGPLTTPIWADEHPNPNIGEYAKYQPPMPRYEVVPRWHSWFTGLFSYEETPRRYRLSRDSSGNVMIEAVTAH